MNIAVVDNLPIREIKLPSLSRDARFQRAFDRVSAEVVSRLIALRVEERRGVGHAFFGHFLQVETVHLSFSAAGKECYQLTFPQSRRPTLETQEHHATTCPRTCPDRPRPSPRC